MIKLFASDLDGTLFNAFHNVDRTILDAARAIVATGAHLVLATGRTVISARDLGFEDVPIEAVGSNGSIIRDGAGEIIKTFPLDPAELEDLMRSFPHVCFDCVAPEGSYITGTREDHEAGFRRDGLVRRIVMRGMRQRRGGGGERRFSQSMGEVLAHEICKVNCRVSDDGLERELKAYLAEHSDTLVNAPFNPVMFEITQVGVNKGASVAWLAEHLGYAESEVAVYGDGGNDLVMLERFEHAYATANGSDEAKRAAGTVIGPCYLHAVPRHMFADAPSRARARGNRVADCRNRGVACLLAWLPRIQPVGRDRNLRISRHRSKTPAKGSNFIGPAGHKRLFAGRKHSYKGCFLSGYCVGREKFDPLARVFWRRGQSGIW